MLEPIKDVVKEFANDDVEGVFINIPNIADTNPDHKRDEMYCNRAYKNLEDGTRAELGFYNITLPADTIVEGTDLSFATFTVNADKVDINNKYADTTHSILLNETDKNGELKNVRVSVYDKETGDTLKYDVTPQQLKTAQEERYQRFKAKKDLEPNRENLGERSAQAKQISEQESKNEQSLAREEEISFID